MVFSRLFLAFLGNFRCVFRSFSIYIHISIYCHFAIFSKCWLAGPLQWPVGSFQLIFNPNTNLWLRKWTQYLVINLCFFVNYHAWKRLIHSHHCGGKNAPSPQRRVFKQSVQSTDKLGFAFFDYLSQQQLLHPSGGKSSQLLFSTNYYLEAFLHKWVFQNRTRNLSPFWIFRRRRIIYLQTKVHYNKVTSLAWNFIVKNQQYITKKLWRMSWSLPITTSTLLGHKLHLWEMKPQYSLKSGILKCSLLIMLRKGFWNKRIKKYCMKLTTCCDWIFFYCYRTRNLAFCSKSS